MQAAKIDPALHVEDGVAEAWSQFIDALADHHNALEELRDTVETLDALLSPKTGPEYTDVDEMIGDLLGPGSWTAWQPPTRRRCTARRLGLTSPPP